MVIFMVREISIIVNSATWINTEISQVTYLGGPIQYWNMFIHVESIYYMVLQRPESKFLNPNLLENKRKLRGKRGKYHPHTSFRHAGRSFLVLQHIQYAYTYTGWGPL